MVSGNIHVSVMQIFVGFAGVTVVVSNASAVTENASF